jgi:protoheme IX farnesyltransferase
MGWTAARGVLGPAGWGLFAILFLWQLPHFLAIGWLYRDDYARGGFPMLAVTDRDGTSTGRQALLYSAALLPVTLAAGLLAGAGNAYLWGALVMGAAFLACAGAFAWRRSVGAARRLFFASVLYLPLLLGLMVFAR